MRARYGASPWHLAAMLGCFLLSAYAVSRVVGNPSLLRIAVWFVGAAIVWDLVVGPLLALLDRTLRTVSGVPLLNHLRAPLLLSLLLLAVWLPVIAQRSEGRFLAKSGLSQDPFLVRWLVLTAVAFAVSLLVYAIRVRRAGPGVEPHEPAARPG